MSALHEPLDGQLTIYHAMPDQRPRLSPHFAAREFDCNDGTRWPEYMEDDLRRWCRGVLEPMRAKFGGPCVIHSAFRTYSYNRLVGGAARSYHRYDVHRYAPATDVSFPAGTPRRWAAQADVLIRQEYGRAGGIGLYERQRFVHLDARSYRARW